MVAGIDQDIERMVDDCQACQEWRRQPPPSPLCTWPWPSGPWERVHVDFAGPFKGSMFLVVVDAYSKWLEVVPMTTTSAGKTIEVLRELFSRYGLPQVLVSDNGPQFTASEFGQFMKVNGIAHRRGAPYHPATNGEAERFVQTFKLALNKSQNDGGTLSQRLSVFLLSYRTTPHTTTGVPPAELFMGRQLRVRLDLLHPAVRTRVENKQADQCRQHDKTARLRSLDVGESVLVRNFRDGPRWVRGRVCSKDGPASYQVEVGEQVWKRHIDQLLACWEPPEDTGSEVVGREVLPPVVSSNNEAPPEGVVPGREEGVVPQETDVDTPHDSVMPSVGPVAPTPEVEPVPASEPTIPLPSSPEPIVTRTYPRRERRPREFFDPS